MIVRSRLSHTLVERLWPALAVGGPMLWLGFSGGGFFASTTALAAMGASLALLLWVTLSLRPFAAVTATGAFAVAALAGFAVWTLVSAWWSESAGRAVIEFDRALLYALVTLLAVLAFNGLQARRGLMWGTAVAGVVLCGTGLVTRILPGVWSADPTVQADRLSYPVGYWNALGLLAAITLIVLFHLSSSQLERRSIRVLSASMWPAVAVALFFTFSRGALALVPVGMLIYLVLGRPRHLVGALLAVLPTTAGALAVAYGADALSTEAAATAGVDEGRTVALVLAGCMFAAAAIRFVARPLDDRVERLEVPRATRRRIGVVAVACLVPLVVGGALATGGVATAKEQIERFTDGDYVSSEGDRRDRLRQLGNNGRIQQWDASIDAFADEPLHGTGAGTYVLSWQQTRPYDYDVEDGHSLYAEVLGELGLVGLALLLAGLGALLVGAVRRARGPDRTTAAGVTAVFVVWAVHAGIDWDWEMPVVTLPALALAAAMAGRPPTGAGGSSPDRFTRVLIGLGCLGLALTPAIVWHSSRQLESATRAFRAGDCATSVTQAVAAIDTLGARAEPFTLLGYCNLRFGRLGEGEQAMRSAVSRDPRNWETHYGLALALALRGRDPRPAARRALELNPFSKLAREVVEAFDTDDPRTWRRRAPRARLPT